LHPRLANISVTNFVAAHNGTLLQCVNWSLQTSRRGSIGHSKRKPAEALPAGLLAHSGKL
jgi:hypothetical protein